MKKLLIVFVLVLLAGSVVFLNSKPQEPEVQGVTKQVEVTDNAVLKKVPNSVFESFVVAGQSIILDIRTPEEFASDHIAKALNLDFYATDFKDQLQSLDKNADYLIYCRSGNRSAQTLELMRTLGFQTVYELEGGINVWKNAGLPLCKNC